MRAGQGVSKHDNEVDACECDRQRNVLRNLGFRRSNELWQERRKEQIALRVGHGNKKAAKKDGAGRRLVRRTRFVWDCKTTVGSNETNAEVCQICDADPFDCREPKL